MPQKYSPEVRRLQSAFANAVRSGEDPTGAERRYLVAKFADWAEQQAAKARDFTAEDIAYLRPIFERTIFAAGRE